MKFIQIHYQSEQTYFYTKRNKKDKLKQHFSHTNMQKKHKKNFEDKIEKESSLQFQKENVLL